MFFGNVVRVFFSLLNDLWSLSVWGTVTLESWTAIDNSSKCQNTRKKLWKSRGDGEGGGGEGAGHIFQSKMSNAWARTNVVILYDW